MLWNINYADCSLEVCFEAKQQWNILQMANTINGPCLPIIFVEKINNNDDVN